jgi:hypothetical protein
VEYSEAGIAVFSRAELDGTAVLCLLGLLLHLR